MRQRSPFKLLQLVNIKCQQSQVIAQFTTALKRNLADELLK